MLILSFNLANMKAITIYTELRTPIAIDVLP